MPVIASTILSYFATSKLLDTMIGGWIGNRADALLCASSKVIVSKLINTAGQPDNHDIQRAVRISYLSATLVACEHLMKTKYGSWQSAFSQDKSNLTEVSRYLTKQIREARKGTWIPASEFDSQYDFFIQSKNGTAQDYLPDLISDLLNAVFWELERQRIYAEIDLKACLRDGWEYQGKKISWYDLTAAFFKEQLKTNPRVGVIIQTQYLSDINEHVTNLNVEWSEIEKKLDDLHLAYVSIVSRLEIIINALDQLTDLAYDIRSDTRDLKDAISDLDKGQGNIINAITSGELASIPHHLVAPPFLSNVFLGREADLQAVYDQLFSDNEILLLVHGRGGIGKTSLASHYYHNFHNDYKHAAWILSDKSISNALLSLGPGLGIRFAPEEEMNQRFERVLHKLSNLQEPSLLIIDNVNEQSDLENNFQHLKRCSNLHVIITTRITDYGNARMYQVEGLLPEKTIVLFKTYYPDIGPGEENLILEIRKAVYANTLVLELLAKNLKATNLLKPTYSISELVDDLKDKGLFLLRKSKKVHVNYQGFKKESPEDVIRAMYDIAQLVHNERIVLSTFAVLPSEIIPLKYLESLINEVPEYEEALIHLNQLGWIEYNKTTQSFKCSPVVQQITKEKNQELLLDCEHLLQALCDELDSDNIHHDNYIHAAVYVAYAENVIEAISDQSYAIGRLWSLIGNYYDETGDVLIAMKTYQQMEFVFNKLVQDDPQNVSYKNGLAISYSKLGSTHSTLGNLEKALTYFEKRSELGKQLYDSYPQNVSYKNGLAISYEKLGETHSTLGNLEKALTYFEKRSELGKQLYDSYPQNVSYKNGLAISYSKLGSTHSTLGNLEKALTYYEEDAKVIKELYDSYPQNVSYKNGLAISYEKLGETHSTLGNLEKALTYYEEDAKLSKELYDSYPQNVSYKNGLAISYSKLGETHSTLGNLEKALTYFEKRSELGKQLYDSYPQNVSYKNGLAISYEKLGETHSTLGNLEKALTYFEKRSELGKQLYDSYPQNVSYKNGLAISYEKLGSTHSTLGNLEKALTYYEEDAKLSKELYDSYPQNVSYKNGLAISYSKLGVLHKEHFQDDQKGRQFLLKAQSLWVQLTEQFPDYPEFQRNLDWANTILTS